MEKYVLRLDVEINAESEEDAQSQANQIITSAQSLKAGLKWQPSSKNYRWALVQAEDGFNNPDLEKDLRYLIMDV